MRTWEDSFSHFRVDEEFLGLLEAAEGIVLHLHKANGVKIKVLIGKMSNADIMYISSVLDLPSDSLFQVSDNQRYELQKAKSRISLAPDDTRRWVDRSRQFQMDAKLLEVHDD